MATGVTPPPSRIGLIAGAGQFPIQLSREAARQGTSVVAFGIQGWVDPGLASAVAVYEEVTIGQFQFLIERLKAHGISQAVMAGKVTKEVLFDSQARLDNEMYQLLAQAQDASVASLLGLVAKRLAREGIALLDSSTFLQSSLCPVGVLTRRPPTDAEQADIQVGVPVARALAAFDVGQTVVVKKKVVVALEALEGTDATIQRAGSVAGRNFVVIKMASPNQDRRFDLPIVGKDTLELLSRTGGTCLAVEAGTTLLLERDLLVPIADRFGLCLVGLPCEVSTR